MATPVLAQASAATKRQAAVTLPCQYCKGEVPNVSEVSGPGGANDGELHSGYCATQERHYNVWLLGDSGEYVPRVLPEDTEDKVHNALGVFVLVCFGVQIAYLWGLGRLADRTAQLWRRVTAR